jgi:hypothetical protein
MASKGSTSSNKKKATARGRANEKAADGGAGAGRGTRTSVREMSQDRFPGERPLTGEDRPADRKGGKAEGLSAKPRGRQGVKETTGKTTDRRPTSGRAKPGPLGRHM